MLILALLAGACGNVWGARTGKDLQACLDAGKDVVLVPGEVIELEARLVVRHAGQKVYTEGALTAGDFAVIRHANGPAGMLIEAYGMAGFELRDLILDGNRDGFRSENGVLDHEPMISLGGEGADQQVVERCIVMNSRSAGGWGAIHVQEGGNGIVIRDNIVYASGVDIRGNGRSPYEKPFGWGDGISTASRDTLIENNLIYDATDEGIMLQGAPGSTVRGNVVAAVSREMLGGIALIDPFGYYAMEPKAEKQFDYRGVVVEDNWIIAMGGRIHAGVPMGGDAWHPNLGGTTLVGAAVINNRISGGAGGYGYVANGIDRFTIRGNVSDATYSGKGDGLPGRPPEEPSGFLYQVNAIGGSELQDDFRPASAHVTKVLRSNRGGNVPANALGYRDLGYPEAEAVAVVKTAWLEMLGRQPDNTELQRWTSWLIHTHANADDLRRYLMTSREFIERFGYVNPLELHAWRSERWLKMITSVLAEFPATDAGWPNARDIHRQLLTRLKLNN